MTSSEQPKPVQPDTTPDDDAEKLVLTIAEPFEPCTTLDMSLRQPVIVRPSKKYFEPSAKVYSTL